MLFSLLPTTALAATYPDTVRVYNASGAITSLDDGQCLVTNDASATSYTSGAYVARYEKSTGTLYLKDYHGVATDGRILADGDLNIKVEGDSSFTTSLSSATSHLYGILANGTLTISGSGTLTVSATGKGNVYGIYAKEGVTISAPLAVTVGKNNTEETGPVYGIYTESGAISLFGADKTITATGGTENAYGVYNEAQTSSSAAGNGNIDISGKLTVNLSSGSNYNRGISSQGGDITLNGATVKIPGNYYYGIFNINGNVDIKSNSDVDISSDISGNNGICTYSGGDLTIENSTVKVSAKGPAANLKGNVSIKDSDVDLTRNAEEYLVVNSAENAENTINLSTEGSVTLTASGEQTNYAMITGKVTLVGRTKCETGRESGSSYDGVYDGSGKTVLQFVHESTAPTATVDDVSINGTTGTAIANKDVVITLTNDTFKSILSGNWITNLPNGLNQSVNKTDDTHAKITVSGKPSETSSAPLIIKIPEANLVTSTSDLDVTSNKNAVFAITTPITETLVSVTDLTGKKYNETAQEPTFGGLIRDTDYTVSYAVKSGFTGRLNSDGKPVDAGTYDVTVAGKGSYTGSFNKDFKIDKADPVYTAPTAKTGLAYTGFALDLIDAGIVTKGGEMQYKLDSGSYSTTIPTAINVDDYTVHYQITGNNNYNAVSEKLVGTINITPADQNAPTGLGVAAPTASGGNGKITGTTTDMEYHTDANASTGWTACSDTATEVAPGTYYVRLKADANHNAGTVSTALIVPVYSATKYTVTVTSAGNGTASTDKSSAAAGETVTLTTTPNSGYVFDQWTDKNPASLTIGADGKFTMPSENVSVKATFKPDALTGTASITGNLKYDQELTASLAGDNNTGTLTYTWYRSGETTAIATDNTGKYTLVEDDIGKIITVEITSNVQTGKINGSTTGIIEKADGPAAPDAFTLNFTLNSDGKTFTATIPTVVGGEYSFDGSTYSPTNTKNNCTANTTYTGYARVKETATHKASTATNSTQTAPKLTVATPTFTPNGVSSFSGTQSVTIACDTAGAKIYYTTDGTEPTVSGIEYKTALTLTSTTTLKAIAVKADMNDSAIATATFTKASSGGGGSGGGSYVPKTQKPEIKAAAGGKTVLSKDGTTLTITADAGKVIDKVLLNGKDMGAVSELKGLKTGDKVEVIFKDQVTEPTKEELDKAAKEAAGELVLTARSAKLKNGSVKVMLKGDLKAITDAGYTVKYKFYRSTKKSAGYKAVLTKKAPTYVNTYGKQGTMYYYKAKVMIYDKEGNFVAQTALKQCKYANRLWTK